MNPFRRSRITAVALHLWGVPQHCLFTPGYHQPLSGLTAARPSVTHPQLPPTSCELLDLLSTFSRYHHFSIGICASHHALCL